jgi:chromate transport protein ChrA
VLRLQQRQPVVLLLVVVLVGLRVLPLVAKMWLLLANKKKKEIFSLLIRKSREIETVIWINKNFHGLFLIFQHFLFTFLVAKDKGAKSRIQ